MVVVVVVEVKDGSFWLVQNWLGKLLFLVNNDEML